MIREATVISPGFYPDDHYEKDEDVIVLFNEEGEVALRATSMAGDIVLSLEELEHILALAKQRVAPVAEG